MHVLHSIIGSTLKEIPVAVFFFETEAKALLDLIHKEGTTNKVRRDPLHLHKWKRKA